MIELNSSRGWPLQSRRNRRATVFAALCLLFAFRQSGAQTPSFNRDVVVLDAAHGGSDTGARITDSVAEKDITLQLATRLRSLLVARGFSVVLTRDDANGAGLTTDQRAELANKAHGVACLVLHGSASGNGVQVGTSAIGSPLEIVPKSEFGRGGVAWDRAQEVYVPESLKLANRVGAALARSNLVLSLGRVALRPLDNLMCPAISVEIAPQTVSGGDPTPITDGNYQQRVAEAIAGALIFWRNQAQPPEYYAVPASTGRPDSGGPGA